ncbi:hypothetical protein B9Z55_013388 [Caenorhabditis nigoni]|uniref:C-type lectin domain-containing protein n=1 Tax=Caenorhabditis nigoni TaxID=1611254 RepID=A0A2G5U1G7_9PELO|nr:hypothetical protein B9Z55_013388 [Caenorhabditis nigoni]
MSNLVLAVALCLLVYANGQIDRDSSFQRMCEFWNGKDYRPRENGYESMSGDKCSFQFPHATETKDSARKYCEDNVPFHINDAIPGQFTECQAEATLICKNGWIQMFGRCYRIEKKMMSRDDAMKHCADQGATIAFLHRESLPFRINDYFTKVSQIWIDASESITNDLIHNINGGNVILALDGYRFNLPNIALARVDPNEVAMVLCEYTPPMNQAESNYLLKRFGEIYYPTIFTSYGAFVRTASSVKRNENDEEADNKYCAKVLKPFVLDGKAQSAIPTREFLDELKKSKVGGIVRTSAFSSIANKNDRMKKTCVRAYTKSIFHTYTGGIKRYHPVDSSEWRSSQPSETCDAGTYSTGVVLSRDGEMGLETMSDSRYGPLYCQSGSDTYKYGDCPDGFSEYYRKKQGQKWCHKFFWEAIADKKNYGDAQQDCQKYGAWLSDLQIKSGVDFGKYINDALVGAKRREDCPKKGSKGVGGFDPDVNSPCSRERVFEWVHDAAPNPPDLIDHWWNEYEPNHGNDDEEKCLVMLKDAANWAHNMAPTPEMKFNDHYCISVKFRYFCGREAPIVKA